MSLAARSLGAVGPLGLLPQRVHARLIASIPFQEHAHATLVFARSDVSSHAQFCSTAESRGESLDVVDPESTIAACGPMPEPCWRVDSRASPRNGASPTGAALDGEGSCAAELERSAARKGPPVGPASTIALASPAIEHSWPPRLPQRSTPDLQVLCARDSRLAMPLRPSSPRPHCLTGELRRTRCLACRT